MLLQLMANRIRYALYPDVDLSDRQCWSRVFSKRLDEKKTTSFNYIMDRTLLRPREVLQFCTQALESAQDLGGGQLIGARAITVAEEQFSEERTKDVAAEYRYHYPGLLSVFEAFRGGPSEYSRADFEDVCLELALGERRVSSAASWIHDQEPEALIHMLWRIGFLLATVPGSPRRSRRGTTFVGYHHVATLSIHNATDLQIHPMFHSYLDLA